MPAREQEHTARMEARPGETPVIIHTDGGCAPNPGPGGWAAVLRYGDRVKELSGAEPETTNNRMELRAAIEALRALKRPCRVILHTDSEYLKKGVTEWLPAWKRRGWARPGGNLKNVDLWQELDRLTSKHQIEWRWIRGHTGIPDNERCDRLVAEARGRLKRYTE
ncbi:MAG TPA: ribonuclease HI [Candidatus Hydrogenedentes bacterium]|nr:ribonuclease HI [Candidatus Hydrogenedentota bacterium]